jgi:hypothetical protein
MTFRLVDADAEWGWIGPLVAGVDPCDNDGEDLRACCRRGEALCFACGDGVVVASLVPDRYGPGLELFVRMAVSKGSSGALQRNDEHLDAIARELGASKIVFYTQRPGMAKILGQNWRLRYTAFEREVNGPKV